MVAIYMGLASLTYLVVVRQLMMQSIKQQEERNKEENRKYKINKL